MGFEIGRPHRHYRLTDSTNERARELAEGGSPSGTIVTADQQSAGRGREGRTWSAPAGKALLYSAILRPLDERQRLLPLAAPLAACEAVESLAPVRPQIKWPNDVWVQERKVAGILIEARASPEGGWAVIGVGLNVAIADHEFPADLRWPAASVGNDATVEAALEAVNESLTSWVTAEAGRVLASYRERDALRGRAVRWQAGSGVADGIADDGNLVVVADDGHRLTLGAGEVQLSVGP